MRFKTKIIQVLTHSEQVGYKFTKWAMDTFKKLIKISKKLSSMSAGCFPAK